MVPNQIDFFFSIEFGISWRLGIFNFRVGFGSRFLGVGIKVRIMQLIPLSCSYNPSNPSPL